MPQRTPSQRDTPEDVVESAYTGAAELLEIRCRPERARDAALLDPAAVLFRLTPPLCECHGERSDRCSVPNPQLRHHVVLTTGPIVRHDRASTCLLPVRPDGRPHLTVSHRAGEDIWDGWETCAGSSLSRTDALADFGYTITEQTSSTRVARTTTAAQRLRQDAPVEDGSTGGAHP